MLFWAWNARVSFLSWLGLQSVALGFSAKGAMEQSPARRAGFRRARRKKV